MRRRGMNEASGPERVDEPVNRIPVHGIAVDGARRYHSGQRYPPRLYLVRGGGGGGGVRMAARNRAATSSVYGTSPVLRHNWNSMTATTRGRESRTMATPGGIGWTAGEGFKTVGRRSTTSARSDPLRFFFASFARNIDRGNRAINRASYRVQNMMEKDLPRRWMDLENWRSMLRLSFNGDNINNEIRKLVEECSSGAASVYHDYRASFRENN